MSFQDELNKVTKTPEDVVQQKADEDTLEGIKDAEHDYTRIKEILLEKAKKGEYSVYSGKKHIKFYFEENSARYDFKFSQSTRTIPKSLFSKGSTQSIYEYILTKPTHYKSYTNKLEQLAKEDNINIKVLGYYDFYKDRVQTFSLPGGISGNAILPNYFSIRLECSIEY